MRTFLFLLCFFFVQNCSTKIDNSSKEIERTPFIIGESIQMYSDILGEDRTLNVYLPNGYDRDSEQEYPVIYLLDGSADEDFIHISGLVQFGSFPWIEMIPETIVIGIGNVDRLRDFTYSTSIDVDKKDFPTSGGSEKFITFIENELQPLIQSEYKTSNVKTIIGQSFGGLLATEILFTNPDLFDNYIIASPSLWWDDQSLLTKKPVSAKEEKSIYIAVGKEGEIMERDAKDLNTKLETELGDNNRIFFNFFEEQDHGDVLHLAVYNSFEKLFRKKEGE